MRECQPLCNLFQKLARWLTMAVILTVPCVASSKLTISPSNPKQLSNSTLPFTATVNGELVDGPTKWTSSNTAVATIAGTTGAATATLLSAGTTTITAVHGLTTQDVNGDGKPDLVAKFDTSWLKLHPHATVARLTGWLKNGQSFSGEDKIRVVPSLAGEDPSCR